MVCLRRALERLRRFVGGPLRKATSDTSALGEHRGLREKVHFRQWNTGRMQEEMRVLYASLRFQLTGGSEICGPVDLHIDPLRVRQIGAHVTRGVGYVTSPTFGANNLDALMPTQGNLENERIPEFQPRTVLGTNPACFVQRDSDQIPAAHDANGAHPTLRNVLFPLSRTEWAEFSDFPADGRIAGEQDGIVPVHIEACEAGRFDDCEFQANFSEIRTNETFNERPCARTFASRVDHERKVGPREPPGPDERRYRAGLRPAPTTPDFNILHIASLADRSSKRNGPFVLDHAGGNGL
jgi:hypothetical protein